MSFVPKLRTVHSAAVQSSSTLWAKESQAGTDATGVVRWPANLEAALDDVVAVEVADEGHHARPQGLDHQCDLRMAR